MRSSGITVCMATFNGEQFLEEQIDSILSEFTEFDQLVVVDDCSKDRTLDILMSFAARDARILVLKNESNLGVVKTFEVSLSNAANEIIFLADQDDIWVAGRIDSCLDILANKPEVSAVLVNAELLAFNEKTGRSFYSSDAGPSLTLLSQLLKNKVIGCCFCFRKPVLKLALPFVSGISMHDWWLGCCSLLVGNIYFLDENKIYYRRHSNNASPAKRRAVGVVFKSRIKDLSCFMRLLSRFLCKGLKRVR